MNIIMYTKNNCPNCMRAEFMFSACPTPVNIEKRNVDENEEHYEFLTKIMRSNTLPTFLVPDTHGSYEENGKMYEGYHGFEENLGRLQELLGL
ncbi:glutaredoxin [Bacillus phage Juan]|nr:thioredoxin domain [Bacillus phage Juan]ASU04093.1 glutaredoxin [Bacillus phage Juan]